MFESTEGEREPWFGMFSGGKDVWRRCDGPAADCFRRLFEALGVPRDGLFLGRLMDEPGGEPAPPYGGEVAMVVLVVARRR
jgi:hypothetical protein